MKEKVKKYYLENENIRFSLINLGSTIVQLDVKLANGTWQPTVLSYKNSENYMQDEVYLNSVIGPYAGRIKDANFKINERYFYITPNENNHLLHSGNDGLHNKYFSIEQNDKKIVASYSEQDKTTEFPASSVYQITYTLLEDGIQIDMYAIPSDSTLLNMTQHTYFNLEQPQATIHNHKLKIISSAFYLLDEYGIPFHKKKIENSIFDFNTTKKISDVLNGNDLQFEITGNIDHPYQIDKWPIVLEGEKIVLNVCSDAPDCVIYLSNSIADGKREFRNVGIAQKHVAIAIEPQTYPNAVNLERESKQIYKHGDIFKRKIVYKFQLK